MEHSIFTALCIATEKSFLNATEKANQKIHLPVGVSSKSVSIWSLAEVLNRQNDFYFEKILKTNLLNIFF
jgi:hypothetical protein